MSRASRLAISLLCVMTAHVPAQSAVFTNNYDITAFGFNGGLPAKIFNGSFTLTFDTSILSTDQFGAVTVNSANLPYQTPFELNYYGGDTVTINSGNYGPNQTIVTGFAIAIRNATSATPTFSAMNYYTAGIGGGSTRNGTVALVAGAPPAPGVPEPSTWAMLLLGFGSVGQLLRAQRLPNGAASLSSRD